MRSISIPFLAGLLVLLAACDIPKKMASGFKLSLEPPLTEPVEIAAATHVVVTLEADSYVAMAPATVSLTVRVNLESGEGSMPVTDGTSVALTGAVVGVAGNSHYKSKTKNGKVKISIVITAPGEYSFSAMSLGVAAKDVGVKILPPGTPTLVLSHAPLAVKVDGSLSLSAMLRDGNAYPLPDQWVSFTTDLGSLSAVSAATNFNGVASVTLAAGMVAGLASVTAAVGAVSDTTSFWIYPGAPAEIRYEGATRDGVGVVGGDHPTKAELYFSVRDVYGNLVTEAESVAFHLNPTRPGASVSVTGGASGGYASTWLQSGVISGPVRVHATAGSFLPATFSTIIPLSGVVAAGHLELVVTGRRTMSGLLQTGLTTELRYYLQDRIGNPPAAGTQVTLHCTTMLCPQGLAGETDRNGTATVAITTTSELPFYFGAGAPVSYPYVGLNHLYPALGDPRNAVVTLIGFATGESDYSDLNGNGVFDAGMDQVTDDPSEPFLDANLDQTWSVGETFADYNENTEWDSHAVPAYQVRQYVWTSRTILYSGAPSLQIVPARFVDMNDDGLYNPSSDVAAVGGPVPGTFPYASPATDVFYGSGSTVQTELFVNFSDVNNSPFPVGTTMYVWADSPLVAIASPPASARSYGAEYFFPLGPRGFLVSDTDPGRMDAVPFQICARVTLGDIGSVFTECIDAYVF